MTMREPGCDDGDDAEGAHELQGQVACFACFDPCFTLLSPASRVVPTGAGARPFPVFIP